MVTTVEISMYPFQENYRDLIKDFVAKLNSYEDLTVRMGPTSTIVVGEYARVMQCVTEMFQWSHDEHGRAVFVTKFMLDYDAE